MFLYVWLRSLVCIGACGLEIANISLPGCSRTWTGQNILSEIIVETVCLTYVKSVTDPFRGAFHPRNTNPLSASLHKLWRKFFLALASSEAGLKRAFQTKSDRFVTPQVIPFICFWIAYVMKSIFHSICESFCSGNFQNAESYFMNNFSIKDFCFLTDSRFK